jgi:PAS domain S-box-containing protein
VNLIHSVLIIVASIAGTTALLHIALSTRHEARTLHRVFGLFCLAAAVTALSSMLRYQAVTPAEMLLGCRLVFTSHFLFVISILWFAVFYTGANPGWFPKVLTSLAILVLLFNAFAPNTIFFLRIPEVRTVIMPWGERIAVPVAPRSPLLILADLVVFPVAVYVVTSCVLLWRRGDHRRAKPLALGLAPIITIAYPHAVLVNWGILQQPYCVSPSFLALIILISFHLIHEAAQAATLSRQVAANEIRWRTLLENIHLLVAGVDREGHFNYFNPHFLSTTGYTHQELLGKPFASIIDRSEVQSFGRLWQGIVGGTEKLEAHSRMNILRKDRVSRSIYWSNVPLLDAGGEIAGVLRVGADVTEQEQAEAARDRAIQELQQIRHRLEAENFYLKEEIFQGGDAPGVIGESPSIRYVLRKINEVAQTDATVLIEGETGVGKELVARAIHQHSARSGGPYVRVNCAALPLTLVESELFGHEKGAFTGADKMRRGRFELADGGTLLLDEVGELPMDIQVKLLRVLQEGEFERIGAGSTRKVDVRIIAATNRELRKEVAAGRFRQDLFYRLQVYPITVPPLRDRREDIPILVEHFSSRFSRQHGKRIKEIPGYVMTVLTDWDWPGNVRELENVIERAVISSPGETLRLPGDFGNAAGTATSSAPADRIVSLEELEQSHIQQALQRSRGKISGPGGAAEILKIHPNTLRSKMEKLGIGRAQATGQK